MKKFKKLICSQPRSMMNNLNLLSAKLLVTSGIFSNSLFFNQGYSQEKVIGTSEKGGVWTQGQYEVGGEKYSYKYERNAGDLGIFTRYYNNKTDISEPFFIKKEIKPQNSINPYNPNKTYTPTKHKTDLGDVLNTTNATLNVINLGLNIANLIQNNQRQKNANYNYNALPVNNPPTNYNSNPEENKKAFDEWLNGKESNKIKSLDEVLKEQEQKKADAKIQADKSSKELSDFVEKQAGVSPETKIWFNKEYQEAEEFYKEFYKNDPEAYAKTQNLDKLHKVIGYNSYKLAKEYTPAGPVLEGMEIYNEIKEKGVENLVPKTAEVVRDKTAEIIPGGELMLKIDKEFYEFMKDKNGKNYWEEGYLGSSENISDYWNEEVKKADEFLREYKSNPKLKTMPDEKGLEKMLNADIYAPKIEKDKYSEQINKIAYESDISKVIRYRAYQHAKNYSEAGKVIEGIEKVDEIKKNDSKFFWDE